MSSDFIIFATDYEELDVAATVNQQLTVQKDRIRDIRVFSCLSPACRSFSAGRW